MGLESAVASSSSSSANSSTVYFVTLPNGRVKCTQCPKSYAQSASVFRHFKEVHMTEPDRRYVCRHCGQVNKRARYFRDHLKKVHQYSPAMMDSEGIPRL